MARSTLNFMSYNSTGLDQTKVDWVQSISQTCDIDLIQLQEHFKATKTTDSFFRQNFNNNWDSYSIPAFRDPFQDNGRAKGGLAKLCKRNLIITKERLQTKSWRLDLRVWRLETID